MVTSPLLAVIDSTPYEATDTALDEVIVTPVIDVALTLPLVDDNCDALFAIIAKDEPVVIDT
jgi:hypothetical protein